MNGVLASVQLFGLAALGFVLIGSLVGAAFGRALRARILLWEPRARHRALFLLAALPLLVATTLLLSASLPALLSLAMPALDHCPQHDDHHAHLCFVHLPHAGIGTLSAIVLAMTAAWALARAAFASTDLQRASRVLASLAATGERRGDITLVDVDAPLCVAAGVFAPRILVSRSLAAGLDRAQHAAMLAHERAHVRRRDALVSTLAEALCALHLPTEARWITRELAIAAEQACDEDAAEVVGDRFAVADAILHVARLAQRSPLHKAAPAIGQLAIERRVEALTEGSRPRQSTRNLHAALALVIAASGELHHFVESLLAHL